MKIKPEIMIIKNELKNNIDSINNFDELKEFRKYMIKNFKFE